MAPVFRVCSVQQICRYSPCHILLAARKTALPQLVVRVPRQRFQIRHTQTPRQIHYSGQEQRNNRKPKEKKRLRLLHRWGRHPYFLYQVGGLGLLCGAFYVYNTENVPISNRRRFNIFNPRWEREIAEAQYKQTLKEIEDKLLPEWDPKVIRVKRVLARLIDGLSKLEEEGNITKGDKSAAVTAGGAPWSEEAGLDAWTLHIVDAPIVNAMVLPGNKVFVFTGILAICENDAAVATILGHEIAHAICHHAAERMSSRSIFWSIMGVIAILIGDFTLTSAAVLDLFWQRPMGRTQESEADRVGVLLMAASCYDPRQSLLFWQRMSEITDAQRAKVPEFFSTHPGDRTRIHQLEGWMDSALKKYDTAGCAPTGRIMQSFFHNMEAF